MKNKRKKILALILALPLLYILGIDHGIIPKLPRIAAVPLAEATEATLYSLDDQSISEAGDDEDFLDNYPIAGKVQLTGDDARKAIDAFQDAAAFWMPFEFQCFDPHHALRIVTNGHKYDYLLCYMCDAIAIYEDGKSIAYQEARGSPEVLNELLIAAHVPLRSDKTDPSYLSRLEDRAKKGKIWAQNRLGGIYYHQKKYAEAFKYWRMAAESDNSEAQFYLAKMYEDGKGVKQDLAQSLFWNAVAEGEFWTDDSYDSDKFKLSTQQISDVKKAVARWRKSHPRPAQP